MGMMDWVDDETEEDEDSNDIDDQGDPDEFDDVDDFGDDFDDDFGELDDGSADEFDDDFDDFDDGSADEFDGSGDDFGDDGGGTGEKLADFEDRIGELETEVGSISSTMNTVREENKQIGETVDELDDTIRKLLDIYEMVTRGINPFVDDAQEMGGLEHGDGAFGLFESEEEEEDDLDPEVANADAESFFDDDFGELDADAGEQHAERAAGDELADAEPDDPEALTGGTDTGEAADGGGASFDELKAEYEEDGWDEPDPGSDTDDGVDADTEPGTDNEPPEAGDGGEETTDGTDEDGQAEGEVARADTVDATAADDVDDAASGESKDDSGAAEGEDDGAATDDLEEDAADGSEPVSADAETSSTRMTLPGDDSLPDDAQSTVEPAQVTTDDEMFLDTESDDRVDATASTAAGARGGTPGDAVDGHRPDARSPGESETYLSTLPPTYAAESVAMEWMRYLVSVGGPLGASRALREYEEFGWISAEVRATLDTYVRLAASPGDDAYNGPLSVGHHETSLTYVSRLGTREPDATALGTLVADGGGHDGLRR